MTIEEFLNHTAGLDWMTAPEIGEFLDEMGLWPENTPMAEKFKDVLAGLRAEDVHGQRCVARRKRRDGVWVFKQEEDCTCTDLELLAMFYEARAEEGKANATEARDAAVQHGNAHQVLPWEETP